MNKFVIAQFQFVPSLPNSDTIPKESILKKEAHKFKIQRLGDLRKTLRVAFSGLLELTAHIETPFVCYL